MKYLILFSVNLFLTSLVFGQSTTIGTTTYDLQTYSSSKNRIVAYSDGQISATWIGSSSLSPSFSDRGMYFNQLIDGVWGAYPTARIEGLKAGFGEIVEVDDHEIMVSNSTSSILLYKNSAPGAEDWTPTAGSGDISGSWPVAYCPAGSDDIYLVNANSTTPTELYFSKSTDGGESWAIAEYTLPFLTTDFGIGSISAEVYQIIVYGADVYVLFGTSTTDMVLLYSSDFGNPGSWGSSVIRDFPIDNYTGAIGQTTDIGGDGIADTILTNDGTHEMIIAPDGTIHIFTGAMKIYDNAPAVSGWSSSYNTAGIFYYKIGLAEMQYLDLKIDWKNDDGLNDYDLGIGVDASAYGARSFTSSPTAAIDEATGKIYLVYMMQIEYTDQFDNPAAAGAQSKSDLFGIYSLTGGDSWSNPVNLTYNAYKGIENTYPSAAERVVDGKVHVMWMEDTDPGTYFDFPSDPIHTNNIKYSAWDDERFSPYPPQANFSIEINDLGVDVEAVFTNLSIDGEIYEWNFDDGDFSNVFEPVHIFGDGSYNVCLTVTNAYGVDTHCESIINTSPPIANFSFTGEPNVLFTNLSTGGTPDSYQWNFDDGFLSTLENPNHAYTENGIYNVCLTVTNILGTSTYCSDVEINYFVAPIVDFDVAGGPVVTFTDLTSGGPTSWSWNFGDGDFSTLQNPVHTFDANGVYNVCLTATNAFGFATGCQSVTIDEYLAPVADFSFTGDPTVSFTDITTNDPTSWFWDFGDGFLSNLQNPLHTFDVEGNYNVCLTATAPGGTDEHCQTISIANSTDAPVVEFEYSFTGGMEVSFIDLSTNIPSSWIWDFGDGSISGFQNPSHIYPTTGEFTVCLTASNGSGDGFLCKQIYLSNSIENNTMEITAYPNPVSTQLFVELAVSDNISGKIFSITGESFPCNIAQNGKSIVLNTTHLPSGFYLLQLTSDKEIGIFPFEKINN